MPPISTKENRPRISLHGHIHESPYMSGRYHTDICGTLSINPGHNGKELHAVYFDSSDPHASMVHSIFIKEPPRPSLLSSRIDRCARMVKACFMKTVLMK